MLKMELHDEESQSTCLNPPHDTHVAEYTKHKSGMRDSEHSHFHEPFSARTNPKIEPRERPLSLP